MVIRTAHRINLGTALVIGLASGKSPDEMTVLWRMEQGVRTSDQPPLSPQ
jgi:hypothetical protein